MTSGLKLYFLKYIPVFWKVKLLFLPARLVHRPVNSSSSWWERGSASAGPSCLLREPAGFYDNRIWHRPARRQWSGAPASLRSHEPHSCGQVQAQSASRHYYARRAAWLIPKRLALRAPGELLALYSNDGWTGPLCVCQQHWKTPNMAAN